MIGNHYPEFTYEADLDNLKEAVARLDIPYPVAQDNRGNTWRSFRSRYWPSLFLIDKRGIIRYKHIGPVTDQSLAAKVLPCIETLKAGGQKCEL